MKEELRTDLARPFPQNHVHQRKGAFGKTLQYLEASAVIERLNECFANDWTFRILSHQILDTQEVLIHGQLEAAGILKEDFGRGNLIVSRETGEVLSAADAFKSAASDCIKRCARLMGVGAYLYCDDADADFRPAESRPATVQPSAAPTSAEPRLTQKQLSAIWGLARRVGYDSDTVRNVVHKAFGCQLEHLSRRDASTFITELGSYVSKRGVA